MDLEEKEVEKQEKEKDGKEEDLNSEDSEEPSTKAFVQVTEEELPKVQKIEESNVEKIVAIVIDSLPHSLS